MNFSTEQANFNLQTNPKHSEHLWQSAFLKLKSTETKNLRDVPTPDRKNQRQTLWFQIIRALLRNLGIQQGTFFAAIRIFDNFKLKTKIKKKHLKKLCLAIMDLAIKLKEPVMNTFPILKYYSHFSIDDPQDLVYLQKCVLESFNYDLNFVSTFDYVQLYLEMTSGISDRNAFQQNESQRSFRNSLREILFFTEAHSERFLNISISKLAAVSLTAAASMAGIEDPFENKFWSLTGFSKRKVQMLGEELRVLFKNSLAPQPLFSNPTVKMNSMRVVTQDG